MRRADRDGEAFLRFFPTGDGLCTVRTVEPEHVRSPGDQSAHLSFGVETPEHDIQDALAYWVVEEPSLSWTPSRVPADEIVHVRFNVDRTAKRGYPTLIPVRRNLLRADKLLQNMSTLAQVQATFALIRKHKQFSASAVQTWQQGQADITVSDPVSGSNRFLHRYLPGTILDVPEQTDYEFPAAKVPADSLVAVLQAELRAVAARLVLPEYMLTSNAENANYASTLVAEAPAVKHFERLQRQLARSFGDGRYGGPGRCGALWRVLECAVQWGKLPREVFRRVALHVEPPSPVARDKDKETARAAALHKAGVLSKATWSKWEGLDPARERRQLELEMQAKQSSPGRDAFTEEMRRLLEACEPHKSGPFVGTDIGYDPDNHNANCRLTDKDKARRLDKFIDRLAGELSKDGEISNHVADPRQLLRALPPGLQDTLKYYYQHEAERWETDAENQAALRAQLAEDPELAKALDAEIALERAALEAATPALSDAQRRAAAPWLYKDFKYFAPTLTEGPDGEPHIAFQPTPALRRLQTMQALAHGATIACYGADACRYSPPEDFRFPHTDEQALAWYQHYGDTHPAKLANLPTGGGGLQPANGDISALVPSPATLAAGGGALSVIGRVAADIAANLGTSAAAQVISDKYSPTAGAAVPFIPTLLGLQRGRVVAGRAFQRFARNRKIAVNRPGSAELDALRKKLGAGPEVHTLAVGKTNVPGLEAHSFEGASTSIRRQAGRAPLPTNRPIKSPNASPRFSGHAEEVVANDFVAAVERAKIPPVKVEGDLWMHISNPSGVCNICVQGLKPGSNVPAGIVRQLSERYPRLTIRITAEGGAARPGLTELVVRNGRIVE
jgi:hypothetical protein